MVPFPLLAAFLCGARFSQEVEVQSSVTVYFIVGQFGRVAPNRGGACLGQVSSKRRAPRGAGKIV
jgi:hypothetical protein